MGMMTLNPMTEKMVGVLEEAGVGLRDGLDVLLRFHLALEKPGQGVALVHHGDTERTEKGNALAASVAAVRDGIKVPAEALRDPEVDGIVSKVAGIDGKKRCAACGEPKGAQAFWAGVDTCRKCRGRARLDSARAKTRAGEPPVAPRSDQGPIAKAKGQRGGRKPTAQSEREMRRVFDRTPKEAGPVKELKEVPREGEAPRKMGAEGVEKPMRRCVFCGKKKAVKEFWKGHECTACHEEK